MKTTEEILLQRATRAVRTADKQAGRRLLAQVLHANPRNAQAWLLMSNVVDTKDRQRECLLRALALDPRNKVAQARLEWLTTHRGREPSPALPGETLDPKARPYQVRPTSSVASPDSSPQVIAPVVVAETRSVFATRTGEAIVPSQRSTLDEAQRRRGHRNIMLAGAMTFTLLCGLAPLVITFTNAIPQAQERMKPTPEPVLYAATLWCPRCEQADSPVIFWEKVGDGISRGTKVGELRHDTPVSVLAEEWSQPKERTYVKVTAQGQKGGCQRHLSKNKGLICEILT